MMCKFPDWKPVQKSQWITPKGFDNHSGIPAAHNNKLKHPGAGKVVMHANSVKDDAVWNILRNETEAGVNPYGLSYKETAEANITRARKTEKEISKISFNATCRPSLAVESKLKVRSNDLMD